MTSANSDRSVLCFCTLFEASIIRLALCLEGLKSIRSLCFAFCFCCGGVCLCVFFFPHLCTSCKCVLVCIGRRCNLSLGAIKLNGSWTDIYRRNLGILLHTVSYSFDFFFFLSQETLSYACGHNCFFSQSAPKSVKGSTKKEGSKRKINMSGYILFSSEMRAVIKAQHPDYSFGELSRLVGTEWRNLEATKKAEYEGK